MEQVRFGSDFKNQPRIGQRYIQSTAGAVSRKSKKGELVVEKVNVKRYIAGKKPEWAPEHSSDEESEDEEDEIDENNEASPQQVRADDLDEDVDEEEQNNDLGKRRIYEPRIVTQHDDEEEEEGEIESRHHQARHLSYEGSSDENVEQQEDEELDEEALERRRQLIRAKLQQKKKEEDLLDFEEEDEIEDEESEDESSEYEEDSDSDEETGLRLKPVFVRKRDRVTIQEREKMQEESALSEEKLKKAAEERKKYSVKLVGQIIQDDLMEAQGVEQIENIVITDDENDEEEYEAWKVRELKRIKRDKEEKEAREKEQAEIERIRNLTEDQRRDEFRRNPKKITNKSTKGKYKFLQKYYHRGAFFMDEEDDIYKRDFTSATLEDHFDKTVLPKAMQVKNFGRSGRTKYTHLVDQDTTQADSPWYAESAQSMKFHAKIGGGNKQSFEKPSRKKK